MKNQYTLEGIIELKNFIRSCGSPRHIEECSMVSIMKVKGIFKEAKKYSGKNRKFWKNKLLDWIDMKTENVAAKWVVEYMDKLLMLQNDYFVVGINELERSSYNERMSFLRKYLNLKSDDVRYINACTSQLNTLMTYIGEGGKIYLIEGIIPRNFKKTGE